MAILNCDRCGKEFASRHARNGRPRYCTRRCSNLAANAKTQARQAAQPVIRVWACGGGVDSTAIACLICAGELPKPDFALMVDVGYERDSTWQHVDRVLRPRLEKAGVDLRYPLVERGMTREDCVSLLGQRGWPKAPRTSCYLCPNQTDREWRVMARDEPAEFDRACRAEREIQHSHPDVYLNRSCRPLDECIAGDTGEAREDLLGGSLAARYQPGVHQPVSQIEEYRACCEACDQMRGGKCRRFSGCDAFDAYVTTLLFGTCPRFAGGALSIEEPGQWVCVQ